MIEISYDQESDFVSVKRSGDIFLRDLTDLVQSITRDYKEHRILKVLDDTGQSVSRFDHRDDYDQISQEIRKVVGNFDHIYHAIVAETPANAALSSIYEMFAARIPNYTFKFFSSPEAAIYWLDMNA